MALPLLPCLPGYGWLRWFLVFGTFTASPDVALSQKIEKTV